MFKRLLKLFDTACYTAAQDKVVNPSAHHKGSALGGALVLEGLVGTTKFKNVSGVSEYPYNDSVSGPKRTVEIFTRTTPVADADYTDLPSGSKCVMHTVASTVLTDEDVFVKDGAGTSDWAKVVKVRGTTAGTVHTAARNEIDARGTNSGTGDYRAVYARVELTHASAGSGDAVRGMGVALGGVNALRGAHLTAEIGAAGSVVGTAEGARIDFHTVAGLTLSGGTVQCLNLVTNNASSVLGCTNSAHIRISDDSTYGMTNIIKFGTIVGRSTDADALGIYTFEDGGITIGATNAKAAFRVKTPDGTFYLLGWAAGEMSAT